MDPAFPEVEFEEEEDELEFESDGFDPGFGVYGDPEFDVFGFVDPELGIPFCAVLPFADPLDATQGAPPGLFVLFDELLVDELLFGEFGSVEGGLFCVPFGFCVPLGGVAPAGLVGCVGGFVCCGVALGVAPVGGLTEGVAP